MVYIPRLCENSKLFLRYLSVENRRDSLCRLQPRTGFKVVTGFAKRLPIGLVPEQTLVAAMRNDVIDDRRGREHAVSSAFRAKRVRSKKTPPRGLPAPVITATGGGFACVQRTVLVAIYVVREIRAPRMTAGTLGFARHTITSERRFHTVFVGKMHRIQRSASNNGAESGFSRPLRQIIKRPRSS